MHHVLTLQEPKKIEKKDQPVAPMEEHQDRIRQIIETEQATRGDVLYDAQGFICTVFY